MRRLEIFTIFSGCISIITVIAMFFENELLTNVTAPLFWPSNVSCYFLRSRGILELGAGEWDNAMLIPDRCIFFLETACFDSWGIGDAILDRRHACAVESAANLNPSMNIFLLYLTPKTFSKNSTAYVEKLESYSNVYVRRVRLDSYFDETPLRDWYSKNVKRILSSEDPCTNIYEIARLVTLWKYGGIFIDLDLVLSTQVEEFTNFAVNRKTQSDSPALLGVDVSTALGRRFADFTLDEISGSAEIRVNTTSIVEKFCSYTSVKRMDNSYGFTIYSSTEKFSHAANNTNKHCPRIYE